MLKYIAIRSALEINKVPPNTLNNKIIEYSDRIGPWMLLEFVFKFLLPVLFIYQGITINEAIKYINISILWEIGVTWYKPLNKPIPFPKDSRYKTLNDRKALNRNAIAESRANCKGDIFVGSAIATINVIMDMMIIIVSRTELYFFSIGADGLGKVGFPSCLINQNTVIYLTKNIHLRM